MKKLLFMLLVCSAAFGQNEFTSIKIKNNPTTMNESSKVDILVRENSGPNVGMVRKVTWDYILSVLGGSATLQSVLTSGSTGSVGADIEMTRTGAVPSVFGLSNGFANITVGDNMLSMNNTRGGITGPFGIEPSELDTDAVQRQEVGTLIEDAISGYLPLTGTTEGSPLTGDIDIDITSSEKRIGSFDYSNYRGDLWTDDGLFFTGFEPNNGGSYIEFGNGQSTWFSGGLSINFSDDYAALYNADYSSVFTDNSIVSKKYVDDAISGAATNLTGTASGTNYVVTNTNGTGFTLNGADGTNAGLMLPGQYNKMTNLDANANATYAPKASPAFTGTPTAPTPTAGDNSTKLSTTAYVDAYFQEWPRQNYTGTITWNGTAPSGTQTANWSATRTGKMVTVSFNVVNTVAGSGSTLMTATLPAGLPTPAAVPGYNGTDDFPYTGTGYMITGTSAALSPNAARVAIRKVAAGYELYIMQATAAFVGARMTVTYWID